MVEDLQKQLQVVYSLLHRLPADAYSTPVDSLKNGSIGAHVRHVLEFVKCLTEQYHSGTINYDLRMRDLELEKDIVVARDRTLTLMENLHKPDRALHIQFINFEGEEKYCPSSYFRELLYNVEHCIHHEALIKVALMRLDLTLLVDDSFGVAPSTLRSMSFAR